MSIVSVSRKLIDKFCSDPFAKDLLGALSGTFFFIACISWAIEYATYQHWSLGLLVIAASGLLVWWIAKHAASVGRNHPITMVLIFFILSVLLSVVVCAGVSLILFTQGWADYDVSKSIGITTFRNFYLWVFIDMLPVIDIWQTFSVKSPIEPNDALAGLPVLVFRIFILGFVFTSLRRWWKLQKVDNLNNTNNIIDTEANTTG